MNDPATILVFGRNGQVGWELERCLQPLGRVIACSREDADFNRPDSLSEVVLKTKPNWIVNASAYTAVDKAESESALARRINGDAPEMLAKAAETTGAVLIHYSTDYVFDGSKSGPYAETDDPNPINEYGRSKLAGEQAIAACASRHLIFRISWIYSHRSRNFLKTIVRLASEKEELRIVNDQIGSPTPARFVAQATASIIGQMGVSKPEMNFGLYHLAASGETSWHGFASEIHRLMNQNGSHHSSPKCKTVLPIPSSGYPTPASRPSNSVLDCRKVQSVFRLNLPDWQSCLKMTFNDLNPA